MFQTTFVMEQHLGHRAFYQNLRRFIETLPELKSKWVEVTYSQSGGFWESLPLLPSHIRGTLSGRAQVHKGLSQEESDVVFFNTQVPAALGGALVGKQPYVLCTDITPLQYDRMGEHYGHKADGKGLISRYKHHKNVKLLQGAASILPWSNWVRNSLIDEYGVEAERIEVVPPGVDTKVWCPDPNKKSDGVLRILFVGGDLYRKGGQLLLDAFEALPAGSAELHLVTRTPYVPQQEGITVYHNMTPNSPDLIALYQSCHVFVLPTKAEAFGIAAVEASATGLPVIGTRIGGLTDIVVDNETGFLIEPDDKAGLIKKLHLLAVNPPLRQRLGETARARAEQYFDAEKNAARVAKILQKVASKRK